MTGISPADQGSAIRELEALLRLCSIPGLGLTGISRLLRQYRSAEAALEALPSLNPGGHPLKPDESRAAAHRQRTFELIEKDRVFWAILGQKDYPSALLDLPNPPPFVFWKGGGAPFPVKAVGIVGTRKPSAYGLRMAALLASECAKVNLRVVSGGASGVDTAVHRNALDAPGGTTCILGSGIDKTYPPANQDLFRQLAATGCLISPFLPGTPPLPGNFPYRNNLIAALSQAVVVVEGGVDSGAMITARRADAIGRPLLAVPGRAADPMAAGPLSLIRDGAICCISPEDIWACLGMTVQSGENHRADGQLNLAVLQPVPPPSPPLTERLDLEPEELPVIQRLEGGPQFFDELLSALKLDSPALSGLLLALELKGAVNKLPGNRYELAAR